MKEFISTVEEVLTEEETGKPVEEQYVEFKIDDRVLHSYQPTEGQLAFMLASLGRGQTNDQRLAAIINIVLSSLRGEDADYFEQRLLTREPAQRIGLDMIEQVFEFLIEEWFARPTRPSSDSTPSPTPDTQK